MRIGFIGAGKVATAFGHYLYNCGLTVSGYHDLHGEKVDHACRQTHSRAFRSAAEVATASDIVLITTRDDQIAGVCDSLCRQQVIDAHHLVGHMSGAHASLILAQAADRGAAIFSLHPLQAFADENKALAALPNTYFSLEGTDDRLNSLQPLLEKAAIRFFRIAPQHKSLYHMAACILSNYLVTLMDFGLQTLEQSGIPPQEGFQAMLPLIQGTIANIGQMGPDRALTGPIARGDAGTIRQHLQALDVQGLQELKETYLYWGLKTLALARRVILKEPEKAAALQGLFEEETDSSTSPIPQTP